MLRAFSTLGTMSTLAGAQLNGLIYEDEGLTLVNQTAAKSNSFDWYGSVVHCTTKDDCVNGAGGYTVCTDGECTHKNLWPLLPSEWIGFTLLAFLLGLANFAGINGGCLIVPVMVTFFKFDTTQTIALSNSTSFIGNLTRYFLFSICQKHPNNPNKTCIDHNIGSVMVPMILIGSYIGVFINKLAPQAIIGVALSFFIIYLCYTTCKKGLKFYRAENEEKKKKEEDALAEIEKEERKESLMEKDINKTENGTEDQGSVLSDEDGQEGAKVDENPVPEDSTNDSQPTSLLSSGNDGTSQSDKEKETLELDKIIEQEKTECGQWLTHLLNWSLMCYLLFTNLARGTASVTSIFALPVCGVTYFVLIVAFIVICGIFNYICVKKQRRTQMLKTKQNRGFATATDVQLTSEVLKKVLIGSFVSGIVGAQGLGGATTVSAVLLGIEMIPMVSSTTTKYVTMFGGGARALMYFSQGDLIASYALVLGSISMCVTILSMFVLKQVIKKYNRSSAIVFALAFAITLSAIVLPIQLVFDTIALNKVGVKWYDFGDVCGSGKDPEPSR